MSLGLLLGPGDCLYIKEYKSIQHMSQRAENRGRGTEDRAWRKMELPIKSGACQGFTLQS